MMKMSFKYLKFWGVTSVSVIDIYLFFTCLLIDLSDFWVILSQICNWIIYEKAQILIMQNRAKLYAKLVYEC